MNSGLSGYVLAGGKSSRMGRDKALLELAGRPLVEHAVEKLRRICSNVYILGNRPELAAFAPVIPDIHPGCGPLGGMEAALAFSRAEWNLFTPVDMPFLPSALLNAWVTGTVKSADEGARIAIFTVGGRPQPVLCLAHRDVKPFVEEAIESGELKAYAMLEAAANALAAKMRLSVDCVFRNLPWNENANMNVDHWELPGLSKVQMEAKHLWFANLNTPEEVCEAERHLQALNCFQDATSTLG